MRILVIRGGAIGDFIVTLPVFTAIRRRWPKAHVACLGYPRVTALALAAGLIDEALSLDSADAARLFAADSDGSAEWKARLRACDVVLSYLHDPDGIVKANLLRCGAEQVVEHSPLVTEGHATDHFLAPLADTHPDASPSLHLPRPLLERGAAMLRRLTGGHGVFLHPGSGSPKKNWPLEKYVRLASRLPGETRCRPVFLLGEAEQAMAAALRAAAPAVPVVCEPDLVKVASLLAAGTAYVGNDAGTTHLAAAVGLPVVALFGPSDPRFWAPRGARVTVVAAEERTRRGLRGISVETVYRALLLAWERSAS